MGERITGLLGANGKPQWTAFLTSSIVAIIVRGYPAVRCPGKSA